MTIPALRVFAASLGMSLLLVACGSSGEQSATTTTRRRTPTTGSAVDTQFCTIMSEASALLEPDPPGYEPPPAETKADFDTIASLLAQAEVAAPTPLGADIGTFSTAIDTYRAALAEVGYNLGAIYSMPAGIALANDTSHALSPAVVRHLIGPCGISPNGGEKRTP